MAAEHDELPACYQDVEYLKQLRNASESLVNHLQEIEEKFTASTEQFGGEFEKRKARQEDDEYRL